MRKLELCLNPIEIKVGKSMPAQEIQVLPVTATVEAPAR